MALALRSRDRFSAALARSPLSRSASIWLLRKLTVPFGSRTAAGYYSRAGMGGDGEGRNRKHFPLAARSAGVFASFAEARERSVRGEARSRCVRCPRLRPRLGARRRRLRTALPVLLRRPLLARLCVRWRPAAASLRAAPRPGTALVVVLFFNFSCPCLPASLLKNYSC